MPATTVVFFQERPDGKPSLVEWLDGLPQKAQEKCLARLNDWKIWGTGAGARRRWLADAAVPLAGLLTCLAIWLSLPRLALSIGILWLVAGVALGAIKARHLSSEALATGFATD